MNSLRAVLVGGVCVSSLLTLAAPSGAGPLGIYISRENGQILIHYSGWLQSADAVDGEWMDVPGALNPYEPNPQTSHRFFRTRDVLSIFSSQATVNLTVTGPFQTHFELAHAGMPDGIFPPVRETPYFSGTVSIDGLEIPASIRVRGNSSLQECPFPKLKLKFKEEHREGTPFFDAREVKIGTHCAEGGRGSIGRLRDERGALREAVIYVMMESMGFVGPRVRWARIEYRDTSPDNGFENTGWVITRDAMLFDHVEVVAERLGGRALDDEEVAELREANFDEQLIADLRFLHVLLGNWDFALTVDGEELWNTEVVEMANGTLIPVAGDFDLASWVTEEARHNAPHDYFPGMPDIERQARFEIEQLSKNVKPDQFAAGVERFSNARVEIEALINEAQIDDDGRANALRHVAAFFDAIAALGEQALEVDEDVKIETN